ncbi:MAG: bifunctional riboflavin kinase/FAD synthetase [Armatimonadota bacterium]|nr:bifunctional riboflavin kinase/FAD synthetase [Armatimonadota bacterium]MDR7434293.1 bifunctional riboflavin kinase/FAD synthetase [Armatimonadota bacterium]
MEVYHGVDAFQPPGRPVFLALGMFDGVHRGHQHLVRSLLERSRRMGGFAVVSTFDPHPLKVLSSPSYPFLLTTLEERLSLLERLGIDAVLIFPFTQTFRQISPEAFIQEILVAKLGVREVFVGPHHTFGRDRRGNVDLLRRMGETLGFLVHVVEPLSVEGTLVSSSFIRDLLRRGEVDVANKFLGRYYSLRGVVVAGERRGSELGYPTANLLPPEDKLIPGNGVYAGVASLSQERFPAVINVGVRPTFGGQRLVVEAHLLDFQGEIYGQHIDLAFVKRLRDEQKFVNPGALAAQIAQDISLARESLHDLLAKADPLSE